MDFKPWCRLALTLLASLAIADSIAAAPADQPRARDLGVPFDGVPGPFNAITDVAGVTVGHTTLISGAGKLQVGHGPVRPGVTAVLPRGRDSISNPVFAARFTQSFEGGPQETRLGSHGVIAKGPARDPRAACTWTALAQAGILDKPMAVLSEEGSGVSITLAMAPEGVAIVVHGPSASLTLSTSAPTRAGLWYRLWASIDPAS